MPVLTKTYIERLEPSQKDFVIWDDRLSGFGVKVTPRGRKSYFMKYRTQDGRQRKPSIGIHGNITCEQARKTAEKWHSILVNGNDPFKTKDESRSSPTVSELCDRFLKEHAEVRKKPLGLELDKQVIRAYIKPRLGTLKTISVTKADIQKFHLSMKDTPAHANRVLRTLSKMFNLAEDWEYRAQNTNPVSKVERYKEAPRERYLNELELINLGKALDLAEKYETESPHFVALVRLLLLTGARLREIMHAKWEWVNWDQGLLELPDSKTGKKMVYLSPDALELLNTVPKVKGNPHIIVGTKEGLPIITPTKAWARIKESATILYLKEKSDYVDFLELLESKLPNRLTYQAICEECKKLKMPEPVGLMDVRLHDLRHTYASICVGQGMSLHMVAKLLGHTRTRTSERYAHLAHNPISSAAAQVGSIIISNLSSKAKGNE
jgi:integrase